MRRRLVTSTLVIALVSVVALGVPLLLLARHQVWSSATDRLREEAVAVAAGLEDRLDAGRRVDLQPFVTGNPGRRLEVRTARGARSTAGPDLGGDVLSASVVVGGSRITVQAARGPTVDEVREVTLAVCGAASLALLAAVALAVVQGRRLARPVAELAARAERLGRGAPEGAPLRTGVVEVDAVAAVLDGSAVRIGSLLDLQREFAGDAAHQLRTPLTGIALRLEEIGHLGDPAVQQEAQDALAQVERLDQVISALLARARGESPEPELLDLAALTQSESRPWARVLERQGRALVLEAAPSVVQARRDHVRTVLSALLENAFVHGAGTVHLSVSAAGLSVDDDGPGVPAPLRAHVFARSVSGDDGTGIGLALARALAEADGGSLHLDPQHPARFVLALPSAHPS